MSKPGKIRKRWYRLQKLAAQQQHPIWTDQTLYPMDKLPITTEDKWTIERLKVESDINAALVSMDTREERTPAETRWRAIQKNTYALVAEFRHERDKLVAEGHIDDRHIDPDLATDEDVKEQIDLKLAEIEELERQKDSGEGDQVAIQAAIDALQAEMDELKSRRSERPVTDSDITDILDRLHQVEKRSCCMEGEQRRPFGVVADVVVAPRWIGLAWLVGLGLGALLL